MILAAVWMHAPRETGTRAVGDTRQTCYSSAIRAMSVRGRWPLHGLRGRATMEALDPLIWGTKVASVRMTVVVAHGVRFAEERAETIAAGWPERLTQQGATGCWLVSPVEEVVWRYGQCLISRRNRHG